MRASLAPWQLGLCALAISACVGADSELESSARAPLSILHQYEVLIAAPPGTVIEVRERDTNRFIGSAAAGCGSQEGYNWLANTSNDGGCVQGLSADVSYVFSVAGAQNHLVYRLISGDATNHDLYAAFSGTRFTIHAERAACTTGCEAYLAYGLTTAASPSNAGTVNRTPNLLYYPAGSSATLYAQANQGWAFSSWSGTLTGSTNPRILSLAANASVTANFVTLPLSVSISGPSCVAKNSGSHTWSANPTGGPSSAYTYRWTSTAVSGVIGTSRSITLPYGPGFTLHVTVTSGTQVASASISVGACCDPPPGPEAAERSAALPCQ